MAKNERDTESTPGGRRYHSLFNKEKTDTAALNGRAGIFHWEAGKMKPIRIALTKGRLESRQ